MKCLLWMLYGAGGVLLVMLGLLVLRYALWPFVWVVDKYWDWVSDTFESEFIATLIAITPLVMFVIAVLVLILCLAGAHFE